MNIRPKDILLGKDMIGNVSTYAALPTTLCPNCGSKLHRVYNSQTQWKYLCIKERILVDLENAQNSLQVKIE